MVYLLDSNVFIQAKNLHYGFDFCPAFWDWLILSNQRKQVFSIEKVRDELEAGNDDLGLWATERDETFFLPPDSEIFPAFNEVSNWVMGQEYQTSAVNTFFQLADYYLIAYALTYHYTVVTHEVPQNTIRKVKIPNVCIGLNIRHMTPYEMLHRERAYFVLGVRG